MNCQPPRPRPSLKAALIVQLTALLLLGCWRHSSAPDAPQPERGESLHQGQSMGSRWSLRASALKPEHCALLQQLFDEREAQWSVWRQDSEISRFNANPSLQWQPVSKPLLQAVMLARQISLQTKGALDVTLGAAIAKAGFAPPWNLPPPPLVQGWQHLQWRESPPALRKRHPNLRLNVNAVAEGLALDEAAALLRAQGLQDFLLELGGEVIASGLNAQGQAWQVGIQDPGGEVGAIMQQLPLSNQALATSGSYRQRNGAGPHLLDPSNGQPITHALTSVSVLHPRCALADAYATALMILGPQQGREVARQLGLRVFWIQAQ
jgi:thiamine biosynthesis lipoprotein